MDADIKLAIDALNRASEAGAFDDLKTSGEIGIVLWAFIYQRVHELTGLTSAKVGWRYRVREISGRQLLFHARRA